MRRTPIGDSDKHFVVCWNIKIAREEVMRALVLVVSEALVALLPVLSVIGNADVASAQQNKTTGDDAKVDFSLHRTSIGPSYISVSSTLWVSGRITEQTPRQMSKAVSMLKEMGKIASEDLPPLTDADPSFVVLLDSPGGSVDAALEIGRILRSLNATVNVESGASCLSSCVFILAGGTTRYMSGRIGIHRPYFDTPKTVPTNGEVSVMMARMREKIAAHLTAMNVDRALADDMMKISPETIRYLTAADLNRYGLLQRDPASEEIATLREASRYSLPRAEYMKRKARAKEVCALIGDPIEIIFLQTDPNPNAFHTCETDVLSGRR
jgi:ATP-dependent protease ClpP protease subunit